MKRDFLNRMMKMKDDKSFVLTKREAMDMLGIRGTLLAELEGLAKIPVASRRIGYTAAEARRMIGALLAALMGDRRVRAGGTEI